MSKGKKAITAEELFSKGMELYPIGRATGDYEILLSALNNFKLSARMGNDRAAAMAGVMYKVGLGTSVDWQQAAVFFEIGCKSKNVECLLKLILMYSKGCVGFPINYEKVLELYGEGIKWGSKTCKQNKITVCKALTDDLDECKKASDKGDAQGKENLLGAIRLFLKDGLNEATDIGDENRKITMQDYVTKDEMDIIKKEVSREKKESEEVYGFDVSGLSEFMIRLLGGDAEETSLPLYDEKNPHAESVLKLAEDQRLDLSRVLIGAQSPETLIKPGLADNLKKKSKIDNKERD